ncbi:MAG: hypothetical protein ACP5K5_03155 [Candidatus Micrarchaeia archaeon]
MQKEKRENNKIIILGLVAVILIGLLIAMYTYSGPNPLYDDSTYIFEAHEMAIGNFTSVLIDEFTYAFFEVAPYAISFYFFGYGTIQAVIPSLCIYALLILFTFLLAEKL